jgi:haloalkane dehalogenase
LHCVNPLSIWPNQKEITVKGCHFVQGDSGAEIGAAIADFVRSLRKESAREIV